MDQPAPSFEQSLNDVTGLIESIKQQFRQKQWRILHDEARKLLRYASRLEARARVMEELHADGTLS